MSADERTAHEVQRLRASVRDLGNALRLALGRMRPARAPQSPTRAGQLSTHDPYARILANNDRGVLHGVERLRELGVAVVGLNGVGCLVAEAFARYGVRDLVVADTVAVAAEDMDTIPFHAADVGHVKEEQVAARLARLNPDVAMHCLGVDISRAAGVARALLRLTGTRDAAVAATNGEGSDQDAAADDTDDDGDDDGDDNNSPVVPLDLVVVCVRSSPLALRLNELCCATGAMLAVATMGADGASGEVVFVAPGESSCLQCLEKRKMWKPAARGQDGSNDSSDTPSRVNASLTGPALPSTDCILAGLCAQNAIMHLLKFGSACSRLEYDGFLEGLDRGELVPPVHLCPSRACRQRQHQRRPHLAR